MEEKCKDTTFAPLGQTLETIKRSIDESKKEKATERQVGGNHYQKLKIQPIEYIHANGLGFIEGCIVKYISRWRDKGGLEDIRKIKHYCDLLIELEENNKTIGLVAGDVVYKCQVRFTPDNSFEFKIPEDKNIKF